MPTIMAIMNHNEKVLKKSSTLIENAGLKWRIAIPMMTGTIDTHTKPTTVVTMENEGAFSPAK